MALFEIPGWSVPTAPVAGPSTGSNSRKRKRSDSGQDEKLQSAAVNVEKLMATLGEVGGEGSGRSEKRSKNVQAKKGKGKAQGKERVQDARKGEGKNGRTQEAGQKGRRDNQKGEKTRGKTNDDAPLAVQKPARQVHEKPGKKSQKKRRGSDASAKAVKFDDDDEEEAVKQSGSTPQRQKKGTDVAQDGLTVMQARMKQSLDGARFRYINETLYKSDSIHAHDMMRQNPEVFTEYHTGFRHQVQSWPVNPVSHYISTFSSYPPKTVIVDLGCGDAALARALVPKGLTVLSYDLVPDGEFVIEADICSKIPLPGRESPEGDEEGVTAQVADVVVCALSLMSTNWVGCIREAWRILKPGGGLKIAEVASRFVALEAFMSLVSSVGFKLRSKDDSNTHFTLFDFVKVKRKPKSDKEWAKLMARGDVLKPCEYKRR